MQRRPIWYRDRGYRHFDSPVSAKHGQEVVAFPRRVRSHSFYPFIGTEIIARRYRPSEGNVVTKPRSVRYAAHLDSHIFAYYGHQWASEYERELRSSCLGEVVTAYRRLGQCNIHFADQAFRLIQKHAPCVVFAIDVEGFFDSLDHQHLKRALCILRGSTRLSDDEFRVFKAMTEYAHVSRDSVQLSLGLSNRDMTRTRDRLCSPARFRDRIRDQGLIQINDAGIGVPQGAPASAVLSNVYMLDADREIASVCANAGGFYRRYSDDLLLVCREDAQSDVPAAVCEILQSFGLALNAKKTERRTFERDGGGGCEADSALQYLGFTFDGRRALIRSRSLGNFYRRMKSAVRSSKRAAHKAKSLGRSGKIRRRKLYQRFSHVGLQRTFVRYGLRASREMDSQSVRRQVKRHWRKLQREITDAQAEIDDHGNQ